MPGRGRRVTTQVAAILSAPTRPRALPAPAAPHATTGTGHFVVVPGHLGGPPAGLVPPARDLRRLSCSQGQYAILTSYRWFNGESEFDSLTQYRQYEVNHEVGHVLGHGHQDCPGAGRLAPVMQQQTKGVAPCEPNAWPFP